MIGIIKYGITYPQTTQFILGIYIKLSDKAKNQSFVRPKTLRVLPPGGGFPSPLELSKGLASFLTKSGLEEFELMLQQEFSSHFDSKDRSQTSFTYSSSGKASLFEIAKLVRKDKSASAPVAAISSYTCPDIAAVLVRAGYSLKLFDIDPHSLEPKLEHLASSVDLIVLSNLFGLVDSLPKVSPGTVIIDDACQAGLSHIEGQRVGARGDFGISSFGRGKVFPGIGGGLSIRHSLSDSGFKVDKSKPRFFAEILKSQLMWICQFPMVYRWPASLKSLGLGMTTYKSEFTVGLISLGELFVALTQLRDVKRRTELYGENSVLWHQNLSDLELEEPLMKRETAERNGTVLIRYPVIVKGKPGRRDRVLAKLRENGLGASASYPSVLADYQELSSSIVDVVDAGAREVAENILTLPVHKFLRSSDIQRTVELIKETV